MTKVDAAKFSQPEGDVTMDNQHQKIISIILKHKDELK
jgi:hypothetical protein